MGSEQLKKKVGELTVEELLSIIDLHFRVRHVVPNPIKSTESQIKKVPLKKLSQLYGWGKSTIYRWCNEKYIPHHPVGGQYWFDLEEIDKWISEKKVRTKEEIVTDFEKGKKFFTKSNR